VPIFKVKSRTWESYVAGIAASGALMASAIVVFVILIGVVTLKTWPKARGLLGGGGGDVALREPAQAAPASAQTSPPDLVQLFGGPAGPAPAPAAAVQRGGSPRSGDGVGDGLTRHGGAPGEPGGSNGSQPIRVQESPAPSRPRDAVSQAISGVGNTVQGDTQGLGDALGRSDTGVGAVVSGLGRTLNNDLQTLAGK
jgi:hypothetical protein